MSKYLTSSFHFVRSARYTSIIAIALGLTVFGFLVSFNYTGESQTLQFWDIEDEEKPSDCYCKSEKTGRIRDFCYQNPQNKSIIGKSFNCKWLKILERLDLVDPPGPFVNLSNFNSDEIVFVTASSDDHIPVIKRSMKSVFGFYPKAKYIFYGLDLSQKSVDELKMFPNVEYRVFNTSGYPSYSRVWLEYRFKPLIVAEIMKEYGSIWWLDAHIKITKKALIENLKTDIEENVKEPGRPHSILFFVRNTYSNTAVMLPEVLDYFPSHSVKMLKWEKASQLRANFIFFAKTEYTVEIIKWWVLCALEKDCMAPSGAVLKCDPLKDPENKQKCFRYDQSVMNLLLFNEYLDWRKYHAKHPAPFTRI